MHDTVLVEVHKALTQLHQEEQDLTLVRQSSARLACNEGSNLGTKVLAKSGVVKGQHNVPVWRSNKERSEDTPTHPTPPTTHVVWEREK